MGNDSYYRCENETHTAGLVNETHTKGLANKTHTAGVGNETHTAGVVTFMSIFIGARD